MIQTAGEVPPPLAGAIEFDEVVFAYTQNENVLEKFSTSIALGETVALVGHTGAGKSSIIKKLLTRFYEFQVVRLLSMGLIFDRFDLTAYRRQLGSFRRFHSYLMGQLRITFAIRFRMPLMRTFLLLRIG